MESSNITGTLDEIEDAVYTALLYKFYPLERIDAVNRSIDSLIAKPENLSACESYFKARGENDVLYFISNILYNLKTKSQLVLTPDVFKWLGSVWKNFLTRNRTYQENFSLFEEYRDRMEKYIPRGSLVHKLENVNLVTQDFLVDSDDETTPLRKLERFHKTFSEIMSWMKPTYYFMLDYYYEWQARSVDSVDKKLSESLESFKNFGQSGYSYGSISFVVCQSLAILEALYLVLKKKKTSRQIVSFDGKSRLLSTSEVYEIYRDKFQEAREELARLK
ncbi:MAG: hypothetical protein KBA61_12055 [Spirochaetes bacterium]|nr:hypothetical protein [Spirochaetota bacterium]